MLHAEGDADDGDAEDYPEEYVRQEYPYPADKEPDDIHQKGQTTAALWNIDNLAAERPQCQHAEFQGLQPERDTDYRNEQSHAGNEVLNGDEQSAEDYPDNIS